MTKDRLIKEIKRIVKENSNIDGIKEYEEELLGKILGGSEEELQKHMKEEKLIDESGEFNQYMLQRFVIQGLKTRNRRLAYENQNGIKANPYEKKNELVMLEKTVTGEPIEMHFEGELPKELVGDGKGLRGRGMQILKMAFCDAILKIRKQWKEDETGLDNAHELKVVSFMINGRTAEFLRSIGFDSESVRLIPTDYKEPPVIKQGKLETDTFEHIQEVLGPYFLKYGVHKDAKGEKIPTLNLGFATIKKDELMSEETVRLILAKREEILSYFREHHIDIPQEKYGFIKQEDFEAEYGFKAEDYMHREGSCVDRIVTEDILQQEIKEIAKQPEVPELKEEACSDIKALQTRERKEEKEK